MGEHITRHPEIAWVDTAERITALRLADLTAVPMILRGSAADIWRALGSVHTVAALVEAVADVYGLDDEHVAGDIAAWLVDAVEVGLITRAE